MSEDNQSSTATVEAGTGVELGTTPAGGVVDDLAPGKLVATKKSLRWQKMTGFLSSLVVLAVVAVLAVYWWPMNNAVIYASFAAAVGLAFGAFVAGNYGEHKAKNGLGKMVAKLIPGGK